MIVIEVTQEDIIRGIPEDEHQCPIALAFKRTTSAKIVSVLNDIIVTKSGPLVHADGSEKLVEYLIKVAQVAGIHRPQHVH